MRETCLDVKTQKCCPAWPDQGPPGSVNQHPPACTRLPSLQGGGRRVAAPGLVPAAAGRAGLPVRLHARPLPAVGGR